MELHWTPYDHPIIAGYNVYRREQGGTYPPAPLVQVGRISSYTDQDVVPGQEYVYIVHSRDAAGNQHQPSDEASGTPQGTPMLLAPPDGTVTTTQEITFTWQAGVGPSPEGYNLSLDGSVVTTTNTTWATVLSAGIHTWTVRAYTSVEYSDWVSPSWTIEVTAPPLPPALLLPPDGTITTSQVITLAWQAGAGLSPESYRLNLDGSVVTTTNTNWPTVLTTGVHTWTVRAHNEAGHSDWVSPSWTLEVTETLPPPSIPLLLAPSNSTVTTTQTLTFTWRASPGALPTGYNLSLDSLVFTTTDTSWATILPIGVHTWTVRAYNEAGYSDWVSPAWILEVTETLSPPSTPTLLTPPDNTITTTKTITFAWRPNPGATPNGYNLQLDTDTLTTTNTTWTTLLPIGVHTWAVRSYNGAGPSPWAAPWRLEIRTYRVYLPQVLRESQSGSAQIPR